MDLSDCSPKFINHLEKYYISNGSIDITQERLTKEGQKRDINKNSILYKHLIPQILSPLVIYRETLFEKFNIYHDALFTTSIPEFPYVNVRTVISKIGNCHSCIIFLIKQDELHLFTDMYNSNRYVKVK